MAKKQNRAILALEQKIRDNPHSLMFSRLADMYRDNGDVQTAISLCVAGVAKHPNYVTGRLVLGRCYKEQKNFPAAVDELTKACEIDGRNHAALKMLADIFLAQGRAEAAGSLYGMLAEMEPDNSDVRRAAVKHKHRINGDIYQILGLRPTIAGHVEQNLEAAGVNPFDNVQNLETVHGAPTLSDGDAIQNQPTGADIENQLDNIFGNESAAPNIGAIMEDAVSIDTGPTGTDIENQLDNIFGNEITAPNIDAIMEDAVSIDTGPTGTDIENQLDNIFGNEPAVSSAGAVLEDAVSTIAGTPTGADIENQLDNIFGNEATAPQAGAVLEDIISNGATETDIDNQLDQIFGGQTIAAPQMDVAIDIAPMDSGELTESDADNQLDRLFDGQTLAAPQMSAAIDIAPMTDSPTETDNSGQLDEIFGGSVVAAPQSVANEQPVGAYMEESPTGDDIENKLDQIFGDNDKTVVMSSEIALDETPTFDADFSEVSNIIAASPETDDALSAAPRATDSVSLEQADMVDIDQVTGADVENQLDVLFGASDSKSKLFDFGESEETMQFNSSEIGRAETDTDSKTSDLPDRSSSVIEEFSTDTDESPAFSKSGSIEGVIEELDSVDVEISNLSNVVNADEAMEDMEDDAIEDKLEALFGSDSNLRVTETAPIDAAVTDTIEDIDASVIAGKEELHGDAIGEDNFEDTAAPLDTTVGDLGDEEAATTVDDVQDKIQQLFKSERSEEEPVKAGTIDESNESVLDDSDTPFDLPDHVLTSTLADIYYQQGQPQLALHIYERLALRSPEDERLLEKIEDIKEVLLHQEDSGGGGGAITFDANNVEKPIAASSGRKKKGTGAKDGIRPLAGVRIKKKDGAGVKKSVRKKT